MISKEDDPCGTDNNGGFTLDFLGKDQRKKLLPSVSTSSALAATLGIAEAVALSFCSGIPMNIMGVPVVCQDSPMRAPAEHFPTLRALGSPPIVIALATQGTFRGFKDTKMPLCAVGKRRSGLLIGRTLTLLITMTPTTSVAAQQGSISMAGHQICLQVWLSAISIFAQ